MLFERGGDDGCEKGGVGVVLRVGVTMKEGVITNEGTAVAGGTGGMWSFLRKQSSSYVALLWGNTNSILNKQILCND